MEGWHFSAFVYYKKGENIKRRKYLLCEYFYLLGNKDRLQVVTVATSETDGYTRFMRSAKHLNLEVEVSDTMFFVLVQS